MAQIDTSPDGLLRVIGRLTREYGETAAANFALDEQLNLAILHCQDLAEQVVAKDAALADLRAQVEDLGKQIDQFRAKADPNPAHAHRYIRATRKPKVRKAA